MYWSNSHELLRYSHSVIHKAKVMPYQKNSFVAAVAFVLCAMLCWIPSEAYNQHKVYVRPTELVNATCPVLNHHDCYTLNQWIESGVSPFISNSSVALLHGVHLITSKNRRILTENVSSLIIFGQPWPGETIISCLHKMAFVFSNVTNLEIHNIIFKSCAVHNKINPERLEIDDITFVTIYFVSARNLAIIGVTIINGGVLIDRRNVNNSVVVVQDSEIVSADRGFFYSGVHNVQCLDGVPLEELYITNSSMSIKVIRSPCMKVGLLGVSIRQFNYFDAALYVIPALWIVLVDIEFCNNNAPLLFIDAIQIDLWGKIMFLSNTNNINTGVHILCGHFNIYSGSRIEFSNNYFHADALYFDDCDFTMGIERSNNAATVTMTFANNVIESGGVMTIVDYPRADTIIKTSIINSNISFHNNTCVGFSDRGDGAIMILKLSRIQLNDSKLTFAYNRSPLSGGLTMVESLLYVSNMSASFENNHGSDGGGMSLYKQSIITFFDYSSLRFCGNRADRKGGGIYVEDDDYINVHTKISDGFRALLIVNDVIVDFKFSRNQAVLAGSDIYGGWIDILNKSRLFQFFTNEKDLSMVASNPTRMCMCVATIPDCSVSSHHLSLFSGEMFEIKAVAVGQRMGVVPSIVNVELKTSGSLGKGQDVESVGRECTPLQFKILSSQSLEVVKLTAQDVGVPKLVGLLERTLPLEYHVLFQQFSIVATMKSCPIGFELSLELGCVCSPNIVAHKSISCNFSTYSINRMQDIWLLAKLESNSSRYYIIIHEHCPFDYCRRDSEALHIHLENPDDQCAFNRAGILCGTCRANFSQILGNSECRQCRHTTILLIIPGAIAAGIVLVILLMLLDLTVSTGLLNGIIFYANIVQMNRNLFFPPSTGSKFLKVFIAWLNLYTLV